MKQQVTAIAIVLGMWAGGVHGDSLTLSDALYHAVFQRDASDVAQVPIAGVFDGSASGIEVRAVPMEGYYGTATDWVEIATWPGSTFSGTLTVPAGWYQLEARAMLLGAEVASDTLDSVGVGEVFITAGQSNSANYGEPAQMPSDSRVSAWNGTSWQFAVDPQPLATGTAGSPWPDFGSILVEHQQVPVGVIAVGVGSTTVQQWLPGTSNYNKINSALAAAGPNGVRAILWHQGESDGYASTSATTYASRLNSIIAQSRVDAGYDVPWGVALASWLGSTTPAQQAEIIAGQQAVIAGDPLVFQGASTDTFHEIGLVKNDGPHFNDAGLREHGQQWSDAVVDYFELPQNTWEPGDPPKPSTHAVELDTFTNGYNYPFSLGWKFTPTKNMVITALGVFDILGDGVNDIVDGGQPVCLFEWGGADPNAGQCLVSATVPVDATAEAAGNANAYYVDIDPITLTAGTDYFIAARVINRDYCFSATFLNDDNRPFERSECGGFATPANPAQPEMPELANTTTFTIGHNDPVHGTGPDDYFGGTFKYEVSKKPGDATGDGVVDQYDAQALAANWLKQADALWEEGDFNGDGKVDDLDASILAANWDGISEEVGVPEPGSVALMVGLGLGLLLFRRRRN
ncbi:MAG: PEP-CTERM sorting domain-containing protein [Pirellulales bacterium]|nr:PEP-CTERM sorting domain-containing protein [Pirellulales bacterium]